MNRSYKRSLLALSFGIVSLLSTASSFAEDKKAPVTEKKTAEAAPVKPAAKSVDKASKVSTITGTVSAKGGVVEISNKKNTYEVTGGSGAEISKLNGQKVVAKGVLTLKDGKKSLEVSTVSLASEVKTAGKKAKVADAAKDKSEAMKAQVPAKETVAKK